MSDIELYVDAMYTCHHCGVQKQPVKVKARAAHEDIVWWLNTICAPACGVDHSTRSPACPALVADIYIPLPASGIPGGAQTH